MRDCRRRRGRKSGAVRREASGEEVCFLRGAFDALRRLKPSQNAAVLVTNQSAVGRGIISLEQALAINCRVTQEVQSQRGRVKATYICPHAADEGCHYRKPAPEVLLQAAEELGLDLTGPYLICDALSDIRAAQAAGVEGVLMLTGREAEQATLREAEAIGDCPVISDLEAAVDHMLAQ
jgi:D-glycero-D-manno-heptose 1,7-bisphosphate phosphatase